MNRGIAIEAMGHGPVDDGLLLLVQQRDQPPPIADVSVYSYRIGVEVVRDGLLLIWRRNGNADRPYEPPIGSRHLSSKRRAVNEFDDGLAAE
jgi:hypothetical protein